MTSGRPIKVALALSLIAGVLMGWIVSCGSQTTSDDAVVAEVGGRKIKMREVTDYLTGLSIHYPTSAEEYTARQKYLDRLIEDKLLIIGGYARTLDADIGILEAVDAEKEKFLLDELYRAEVLDKVTVDESEIKAIFEHWFDRVHFRHIVTKDKALADSLLGELNSGADFGDLAERFSLDQSSRFRGGDPGREFAYNDLPIDLAKLAFSLQKDQLGGPVQTDMGWHVLKLVETRKLEAREYDAVRPAIEATLRRRKQQERRAAHLEQVEEKAKIEFNPATLLFWREQLQRVVDTSSLPKDRLPAVPAASLSQEDRDKVMYTFGDDYSVGLAEFCEALETRSPFERPSPSDDKQLRRFAFQLSLFDILHDEALRQRLDESPIYKERVQSFLESLIADRMRNSILVRGISVTESDVREFYDANPDSFITPTEYHCREILLFKREDAERLAGQLRAGASFEELARLYTKREGHSSKGGDIGWVAPYAWPDYYEPVSKLKPGEWTGPLPGTDQYPLLQLIEVRPASKRSFDDVATEVFENIQRRRRDSVYAEYIDSMRTLYPVTVNEDILKSGLTSSQGQIDSGGSK